MSTRLVLTGIAAGIATAFLAAPVAFATDEVAGAIEVMNKDIRAGQQVLITATCQDPKFSGSPIRSAVLDAPPLAGKPGLPYAAEGKVKADAKPGKHTLSFLCGGRTITGSFEVLPPKRRPGTTPRKPAETKPAEQVQVKPKGGAETGGGALAQQSLGESLDGLSVLGFAAGGLAAAGAGIIVFRNRREKALAASKKG